MRKPQSVITRTHIDQAMTYGDYVQISEELFVKGQTTSASADLNTPKHIEYTKLNLQRMNRIYKTTVLSEDIQRTLEKQEQSYVWLVLSESWCGDAAQCIPIWERVAELSPKVALKVLLRDKNDDVMNAYLTGTARAIPKVICLDAATLDEIGHWGPRPKAAQDFVTAQKAQGIDHDTMIANVQAWYAKDKTQSLQSEILSCLQEWRAL